MSKLDDVFNDNGMTPLGVTKRYNPEKAKQQLLADLLSLPEMQDGVEEYMGGSITLTDEQFAANKSQNYLRVRLRQALQDYFMGGDVGVDMGDSDSPELHEQHNVIKPVPEAPSKRKD